MSKKDPIAAMCREIVEEIINRCKGRQEDGSECYVKFETDFGGNTMTICDERGHTHVGSPGERGGGTTHDLIEGIRNSLCGGPGLSWAKHPEMKEPPK